MLTKRDKILVRPWEQRKYENHLRKVQTALPVIDNRPPLSREHVSHKLKKRQKEIERIAKIENENLILLRKMNYIMKTNRVDNYWDKPLPNFLNRVSMYETNQKVPTNMFMETFPETKSALRKSKCFACSPQKLPEPKVPEERIPWDPPKAPIGRVRSKSVPVRQNSLPTILEKRKIDEHQHKPKSSDSRKLFRSHKSVEDCYSSPQKLVLTRGSLRMCLNFPSDAEIRLQDGVNERLLVKPGCWCKKSINAF